MITSEVVQPHHVNRLAVIYIRQSSPHQVLTNQESLKLQYALQQRAEQLGWPAPRVRVIDCDLGHTAATVEGRAGFQELVTLVTTDQVGVILSYDVTRLTRNCSDWYPLLDVCGFRRCLIADGDGVYDPATINGRLLLGLKGQISELELHTLRCRLNAGLQQKALRGELAQVLPAGLQRDEAGVVRKHPDQEVQARLHLVFDTFLRLRATTKVVQFFHHQKLKIPRTDRWGDLVWRWPTTSSIGEILKNPAYAGAFVRGRTETYRKNGLCLQRKLPMAEWKVVVRDKYEAYVSWETFEKIQAMLADNHSEYDRNRTRGVPRNGQALLHGIAYCGECGHKLVVQYKHGTRYICNYLRGQHQVPVCQNLPADPIDTWVVEQFFGALSAAELDLYEEALKESSAERQQAAQARQQQRQRLHYQAQLAERRFEQADPENRLVAAELERRWETALEELRQAEEDQARWERQAAVQVELTPEIRETLRQAGERLPELWRRADFFSQAQRKALLRCLLDKVVMRRAAPDSVAVRIVWRGGAVTQTTLPVHVGSLAQLSFLNEMERVIVEQALAGRSDEEIAAELTQQGCRSPQRTTVLPSTVRGIRLQHRILRTASQSHPRRVPGWLTVSQLAKKLGASPQWIYDRIYNGSIRIQKDPVRHTYLFPDTAKTLAQFKRFRQGKLQTLDY